MTEDIAGVDNDGGYCRSGQWWRILQEWTMTEDIAGVDSDGGYCRSGQWRSRQWWSGQWRSGQWRRILQEWTMTEWTMMEDIAGVDNDWVKFCELTTLPIMYWAESNRFNSLKSRISLNRWTRQTVQHSICETQSIKTYSCLGQWQQQQRRDTADDSDTAINFCSGDNCSAKCSRHGNRMLRSLPSGTMWWIHIRATQTWMLLWKLCKEGDCWRWYLPCLPYDHYSVDVCLSVAVLTHKLWLKDFLTQLLSTLQNYMPSFYP